MSLKDEAESVSENEADDEAESDTDTLKDVRLRKPKAKDKAIKSDKKKKGKDCKEIAEQSGSFIGSCVSHILRTTFENEYDEKVVEAKPKSKQSLQGSVKSLSVRDEKKEALQVEQSLVRTDSLGDDSKKKDILKSKHSFRRNYESVRQDSQDEDSKMRDIIKTQHRSRRSYDSFGHESQDEDSEKKGIVKSKHSLQRSHISLLHKSQDDDSEKKGIIESKYSLQRSHVSLLHKSQDDEFEKKEIIKSKHSLQRSHASLRYESQDDSGKKEIIKSKHSLRRSGASLRHESQDDSEKKEIIKSKHSLQRSHASLRLESQGDPEMKGIIESKRSLRRSHSSLRPESQDDSEKKVNIKSKHSLRRSHASLRHGSLDGGEDNTELLEYKPSDELSQTESTHSFSEIDEYASDTGDTSDSISEADIEIIGIRSSNESSSESDDNKESLTLRGGTSSVSNVESKTKSKQSVLASDGGQADATKKTESKLTTQGSSGKSSDTDSDSGSLEGKQSVILCKTYKSDATIRNVLENESVLQRSDTSSDSDDNEESSHTLRATSSSVSDGKNKLGNIEISEYKPSAPVCDDSQGDSTYGNDGYNCLGAGVNFLADSDSSSKCSLHRVQGCTHCIGGKASYRNANVYFGNNSLSNSGSSSECALRSYRGYDHSLGDAVHKGEYLQHTLRATKHYPRRQPKITKTPPSSSDNDDDKGYSGIKQVINYITRNVVAEIVRDAKDNSRADNVNELSRKISGSVIDEVVAATVENLNIDEVTDATMECVRKLVTANALLEKVITMSGIRGVGAMDATEEELDKMRYKFFKTEFLHKQKKQKVDTEALIDAPGFAARIYDDKLTDCVADFIINDIIQKLIEDTSDHLTAYVSEYVTEDILDELSAAYAEYLKKSDDINENTSEDETPRGSVSASDKSQSVHSGSDSVIWKEFMDYDDSCSFGLPVPRVYERSIYTFVDFIENPNYILTMADKPSLEDLVAERVNLNLDPNNFIKVGDRWFECISSLLRLHSNWFASKKWNVEVFELNGTDVSPSAFELIYEWMRFRTPVTLFNAVKVLQATRYLQVDILKGDCFKLISQSYVREKIAFKIFLDAEPMPLLKDVRDILLNRVCTYFLPLVGSDKFKDLKLRHLLSMLTRDTIGVNSEAEVFYSALRWLSKSEERLKHLETVIKCVRFPFLPMPMLFRLRNMGLEAEKKPIGTTERVLQEFQANPDLRQMIFDTMTYISLHIQREKDGETITPVPGDEEKLFRPRNWMYHPRCEYHMQCLKYPYQHVFTEDDFDKFVHMLQIEWLGDYPQPNNMQDVEFDGVEVYAPKLKPD